MKNAYEQQLLRERATKFYHYLEYRYNTYSQLMILRAIVRIAVLVLVWTLVIAHLSPIGRISAATLGCTYMLAELAVYFQKLNLARSGIEQARRAIDEIDWEREQLGDLG